MLEQRLLRIWAGYTRHEGRNEAIAADGGALQAVEPEGGGFQPDRWA